MRGYSPELGTDGSSDPARARALLDAAGVPPERLTGAHLLVRATDRGRRTAELIRAQLRQNLGIELAVEEAPSAEVLADRLKDGDFQLCAPLGWSADYPDEQDWLDLFRSNDANNSGQWRNPRYDALVGVADALIDPDQRERVYQQAHRLLVEQVPVAFLAQPESWVLTRSYVAGGVVTAFDDTSLPGDLYPESIRITQH
jgi:oligopeptide transport system substrate-binding protein